MFDFKNGNFPKNQFFVLDKNLFILKNLNYMIYIYLVVEHTQNIIH